MADHTIKRSQQTSQWEDLDQKFQRAYEQVMFLNNQIAQLKIRYKRAGSQGQSRWRSAVRLRLATMEGVRNMFWEYAWCKNEELVELHEQLVECEDSGMESEVPDSDMDLAN